MNCCCFFETYRWVETTLTIAKFNTILQCILYIAAAFAEDQNCIPDIDTLFIIAKKFGLYSQRCVNRNDEKTQMPGFAVRKSLVYRLSKFVFITPLSYQLLPEAKIIKSDNMFQPFLALLVYSLTCIKLKKKIIKDLDLDLDLFQTP